MLRKQLAVLVVGAGLAIGSLVGCGDPPGQDAVSRDDYGEKWPFTVEEGVLDCTYFGALPAVSFEAEGMGIVGLNGIALSEGAPDIPKRFWRRDIDGIRGLAREFGWSFEKTKRWLGNDGGYRVSIGPLIDDGLKLCEET